MRYGSLGWIGVVAWLGLWPIAAHADYMSSARDALKKGDLKTAQIELRNAIRSDPQNAEAHYWLGRVALELGDPVAAEREAAAARERGFDPAKALPLQAQAMLAQKKFEQLLETMKPDGSNPAVDASILVARGYAEIGLKRPEDAQKSFAEAERLAPNAVEPLLADARLAVARSDLAGAETKIDRALAAQPKSIEALLAKAQLLRLKGDAAGAMTVLDTLITDQPSVTQARLDRASLALAMGKKDIANSDINTVLKSSPGNVQGIYLRAVMEAQDRNFKAADADLEKIAGYIARIPRAYYLQAMVKEQLGQFEQAEEAARKYLGRAPNDLAAYKVLARIQSAKRRPDMVIDTLAKVAEAGKGDAETYDLLGRAYAATNRPTDAVQAFQKAQSMAPNDVGLQTRLASVRMGMGQVDAAVGDLEQTLELAPKLPAVGEALFFASLATGDPARAKEALEKIKAAQGDTEVVGNLEGLYQLSMIDLSGAEKTFADLVKKYPDFAPAKVNLARVMAMQGKSAESERLLTSVLSKQPDSEPALTMLASTYVQSGRLPAAISLVEAAAAAAPNNARIKVSLGDLYIRAGTPQKALELVNKQSSPDTPNVDILSLQAAAQLALGQKKEARATYIDLLKLDPNIVGARRQLVALLIEAGDFESARATIRAGIVATPRNYQLYQDLAMIDLKSTGVEAALATADRLIEQDQNYPALKALPGDIYLAANRPMDAANAFLAAQKAAPSSLLVTRAAGALMRARKPDEAVKLLDEWVKKNPDDLVATAQLSEIYIARNHLEDAKRYLEAILKAKPHESVALNNLAWVYQQLGDPRAQGLARQAYVLAPSAQTADTLGWIMTTSGNAKDGVALLRQAYVEGSKDPRIQYHFAVALKDNGSKDDAIKLLKQVVEVKGEFKEKDEAKRLLEELSKPS